MSTTVRTAATIYPSLFYDDAHAAMDWLIRVFGFQKRLVVPGPEETVRHAELTIGDGVVMVSSAKGEGGYASPKRLGGSTQSLSVYVDEPDAHFERAQAEGAEIVRELRTEEYGARGYMARDPEGHVWYFADYRPGAYWTE